MAIICTPSALVSAAKCFNCLTTKQLRSVRAYLLSQFVPCVPAGSPPGTPPVVGCNAPAAPANLEVTPIANNPGSTTIAIDWTQPASNPPVTTNNYAIIWSVPRGPINFAVIPGTQLSYTITGLTPSTDYSIVVRAIHGACASSSSVLHTTTSSSSGSICAQAMAWAARVVANGGAQPSNATLTAVCNYYNSLVAGGVDTLMIADLLFVPDNLIAATTPFFKTLGNDPWTNHNFVNGDLTAAGLTGDGATKYLATGIVDNVAWASGTEFGMGYYYTAVNNNVIDMGSLDINASNQSRLTTNPVGNSIVLDAFDNTNINPVYPFALFGSPHAGGFIGGVRQSGARADVYAGNSVVPFASIGNQLGQGAGRPLGFELFCCAVNNNNGGPSGFTQQTMQWAGVFRGLGMDLAHATTLFNAIQALQVAFGRSQ